jgi:hypothetical protein
MVKVGGMRIRLWSDVDVKRLRKALSQLPYAKRKKGKT